MPRRRGAVPQICDGRRGRVENPSHISPSIPSAAAVRTITIPVPAVGPIVAEVLALVPVLACPGIAAVAEVAVVEAARRVVAFVVVAAAEPTVAVAAVIPVAVAVEIAGAVVAAGQAVRRVAVARLDEVVGMAGAPFVDPLFHAVRIPAVRPARVARRVAVRLALPWSARPAIGIGHLVLGIVSADVTLVVSSK